MRDLTEEQELEVEEHASKKKASKKKASKKISGRFVVAKGSSICCAGRILGRGTEVKPYDLHEERDVAKAAFDAHCKSGVLVEE